MDFRFLMDPERRLLSIGYRADNKWDGPGCVVPADYLLAVGFNRRHAPAYARPRPGRSGTS